MLIKNIIILDKSEIIETFVKNCGISAKISVYKDTDSNIIQEITKSDLLLINTDFTFSDFHYSFERGGFEFVKSNFNRLPKELKIIFFTIEAKENIKNYLLNRWLKYDSKYFIHYPFENADCLSLLESSKIPQLRTTDMFKIEMKHNLLKLLSSVKHDFLNRIARILPDLKAYRSSFLNGNDIEFDMDFKPDFLKDEILKLSAKISENLQRNEFSYNNATNEALENIASLLKKIPDYIVVFRKNRNISQDLLNDLENLIRSIEEIKQKFENTIGFLRDEQL